MDDLYLIEGAAKTLTWRGTFIWKNPLDLFVYQEIAHTLEPTLVLETGTHMGGSALFWADMGPRVVTVDIRDRGFVSDERITYLVGSSTEDSVLEEMRRRAQGERVLVNLDSDHSYEHVSAELEAYAPLVSEGLYLICEDGIDEVLFGYRRVLSATRDFLSRHPEFEADRSCERYGLTNCPEGYLKRR